ncbi:MAG: zinc metallopeptidase [Oscillospiraceae bacterium]|nr:zinc metallopeptidase [Clostridia bacterium]MBQ6846877.1 zinc metallopeptidase [Oscillospiraceae bacterium]
MFGYYPYGFYMDPGYFLVIIAAILSLIASARVSSTFKKYSQQPTVRGITAEQAARKILDENGLHDVRIESISGNLTDHYDPRSKVIRLSDTVRNSTSVASVGVAAHEAGHAVQHATGYKPIKFRNTLVPVANIGSMAGPYLIIIGLLLSGAMSDMLVNLGVWFFAAAVLFQLVTLPVEFNASNRAIATLQNGMYLYEDEIPAVKKVLGAAAMTYVAAAAVSIANLLRFLMLIGGRRRDD